MKLYALFFLLFVTGFESTACTTAIFSGKSTADGRPLLWKHRDSDWYNNKIVFFHGRKFDYAGLVNSEDKPYHEIWAGYNTAGFAIMNSASYNLKPDSDTTTIKDKEGFLMKKALETCVTVDDFEKLLLQMPKPLGVEANFGVIDAWGGAAYFETNNFSWIKYDANDPATAPDGYIIRSNYSFSGTPNKGFGYVRYKTASEIIKTAFSENRITPEFLIQDASRCLRNVQINSDLSAEFKKIQQTAYYPLTDYIIREYTTSVLVVQGVKNGENPLFTTGYSLVGFPLTTVVVPFWIGATSELPTLITAPEGMNAPLCDWSLRLKKSIFDLPFEGADNYVNLYMIGNATSTGIWQQLKPVEDEIFKITKQKIQHWRENGFVKDEITNHYQWIDEKLTLTFKSL